MPRRKPRKARPKEKGVPKGYDSKWEYTLHQDLLKDWEHHANHIEYIIKKKYEQREVFSDKSKPNTK